MQRTDGRAARRATITPRSTSTAWRARRTRRSHTHTSTTDFTPPGFCASHSHPARHLRAPRVSSVLAPVRRPAPACRRPASSVLQPRLRKSPSCSGSVGADAAPGSWYRRAIALRERCRGGNEAQHPGERGCPPAGPGRTRASQRDATAMTPSIGEVAEDAHNRSRTFLDRCASGRGRRLTLLRSNNRERRRGMCAGSHQRGRRRGAVWRAWYGASVRDVHGIQEAGGRIRRWQATKDADLQVLLRERRDSNPRPPA